MIVQYFKVIHCTTYNEIKETLAILYSQDLKWADSSVYEDEPTTIKSFYQMAQKNNEEFYLIIARYLTNSESSIYYLTQCTHNIDNLKANLIQTDCKESIQNCHFIEAEEFINDDKIFDVCIQ